MLMQLHNIVHTSPERLNIKGAQTSPAILEQQQTQHQRLFDSERSSRPNSIKKKCNLRKRAVCAGGAVM